MENKDQTLDPHPPGEQPARKKTYYDNIIVYMKVRDSVLLNFIDSGKFHGFGDPKNVVAP